MIVEIILFIAGIFNFSYFIFYIVNYGFNNVFVWFFCMSGVLSALVAVLLRYIRTHEIKIYTWFKVGSISIFLFMLIVFLIAEAVVIKSANNKPKEYPGRIIVLGARVKGDTITTNLKHRLDTTLNYYEKTYDINKGNITVICSGGKGRGENISEARAMKEYLIKHGMDSSNIILEDKSKNTLENMRFSYEKAIKKDGEKAVKNTETVIVTNDFHTARSVMFAKKAGFKNVRAVSAKTKPQTVYLCYVREAFSLIYYTIRGVLI